MGPIRAEEFGTMLEGVNVPGGDRGQVCIQSPCLEEGC